MHIMVLLVVLVLCVVTAMKYRDYQKTLIGEQQRSPGELLTRQYARLLSPVMQLADNKDNNRDERSPEKGEDRIASVNSALDVLISDSRVLQAGVFDSRGVQIAPHDRLNSLMSQTGVTVTHIEDIKNDAGSVIGYIRVLTRQPSNSSIAGLHHPAQLFLLLTTGVLGLVAGIYLTRTFYKLRPVIKARYHSLGRPASVTSEQNRRR